MATFTTNNNQGTNETKTYTVDFSDSLPVGGTISGGTATHIPPSGSASTPYVEVSSPYIYATLSQPSVVGNHYLDVTATFSDSDVQSVRLAINVVYPTQTPREGMLDIIAHLRGMTNAGVGDYSIAGVPYWSDKQLQEYLDRRRSDVYERQLQPVDEMYNGALKITKHYIGNFNVESGTAVFWIANSQGTRLTETTDYTVDYSLGLVTFPNNTGGTLYYATYRSYDLNQAAADIYRAKAGHYSDMFNFSTHGHTINKGELIKHALQMAEYYSQAGGARGVDLDRSDTC